MRLATWNLWWRFGPWEQRAAAIAATLDALDTDVVCLQETWLAGRDSQAEELGAQLGLHAAVAAAPRHDGMGLANAVLSRWPITTVDVVPLPRADGRTARRHAVIATISAPFGRLVVVSAHLDHLLSAGADRIAQAATLAAAVAERRGDPEAEYPVLVGADLNAVPWSDEVRSLTGASPVPVAGLAFTDCWEHAGDGTPGHTWSGRNPYLADSAMPNRRLDYLLVSWPRPRPAGNPVRCWLAGTEPVEGVQPSDHFAVVADLVTP